MNLALFDFDGTITTHDTFTAFIKYATPTLRLKLGMIYLAPKILVYKIGLRKGTKMRQDIVSFAFKGLSKKYLDGKAKSFYESFMNNVLRPNAMEKLKWHQKNGDRVILVSASLDIYLNYWCDSQNIELICSELAYRDGICIGKYISDDCTGEFKASKVKQRVQLDDYKEIYAYGDTSEDRELLELADHKYLCWKKLSS
jgi:HAD superfamily hydrolase (TIGR01490 family)